MASANHPVNLSQLPATPIEKEQAPEKAALVSQRVGQVYQYTAGAFSISALSAALFSKVGLAARLCSSIVAAPWMSAVALTAVAAGLLAATILTPKENSLSKHTALGFFAVFQGLAISPLVLFNASAFTAAAVGTVALTGTLGIAAMHLKESFEKYERILMVALGAICLASLSALVLPAGAAAIAHQVSYLGGFALFSAMVIYDTHKARSEAAKPEFEPINHAVQIYLDAMNLLVRLYETFNIKS